MAREVRITSDGITHVFTECCKQMESKGVIINPGIIDDAIIKVNQEKNLFDQAAVAMFEIARNQSLTDGNKRMAYLTASIILGLKGYKISAAFQNTEKQLLKIAQHRMTLKDLKEWIKNHKEKN